MTLLETTYQSTYGDKVKPYIINNMIKHPQGSPVYYATLYYGRSFDGEILHGGEFRDRWNIAKVRATHSFISKLIRKCFGDIPLWYFIERHDDCEDAEGKTKKGHYHTHMFIGSIDDDVIENPSPYLMPLFYKEDESGIPINMRATEIEQMKMLLLNACIRQAKWVGRHPASLKVDLIEESEVSQTINYHFKQIIKPDDLNQVIDWDNSSFYKP
tara:strand:+ start:1165 stop:1806 length:642 start_codon:yes stop_codon:yes gene_type:complete